MTDNLPNYATIEPPEGTAPSDYSTHERRAEILQVIREAGSPFAVTQARLAERYDVHESTVSRDMDRLRESVDEHLGDDAKLTTRSLYGKVIKELLETDDWRAKKAAWDVAMDWNDWLADLGEQHREPQRSELDVDVDSRHAEVAYTVVRDGDDDQLPTTDADEREGEGSGEAVDYEALGFTSAPTDVPIEDADGEAAPEGRDE